MEARALGGPLRQGSYTLRETGSYFVLSMFSGDDWPAYVDAEFCI
jgi:hypothetical protein